MDSAIVNASRLQFALTAMYHFLFVPLTLGLSILLGIMETISVITKNIYWRQAAQFWSKLFAINFAMGVATGITMEFQFGTNWSYYSHYVGDIFGIPLALEGLLAFFLESTFVGLLIFGWNRLSPLKHLAVTWITATGTSLSGLWILIANGWMQKPVGAFFNPDTMRMELSSFKAIFFNETAQLRFVHTLSGGYMTGAIFVIAISCYYLLKGKSAEIAKRSIMAATIFGFISSLSTAFMGDESGYSMRRHQPMKLAAIEGEWHTEKAPAGLVVFGVPDNKNHVNKYEIKIPYLMGLLTTRSLDKQVMGINDLVDLSENHIKSGLKQYKVLLRLKSKLSPDPEKDRAYLKENFESLGYALLLKKYRPDIENADESQIRKAALDTVPNVASVFFAFRGMVGAGLLMVLIFLLSLYFMVIRKDFNQKWLLRLCLYSLPLPWIASQLGWIVTEQGRQPWVINEILPTFMGASGVGFSQIMTSLIGFVVLYTTLLVLDVYLMIKYARLGPDYLFENYASGSANLENGKALK